MASQCCFYVVWSELESLTHNVRFSGQNRKILFWKIDFGGFYSYVFLNLYSPMQLIWFPLIFTFYSNSFWTPVTCLVLFCNCYVLQLHVSKTDLISWFEENCKIAHHLSDGSICNSISYTPGLLSEMICLSDLEPT